MISKKKKELNEVKPSEMKLKRNEMKWSEGKWKEMKGNERKWEETKGNEKEMKGKKWKTEMKLKENKTRNSHGP